jgi:GTP pyrophosphokinase
VLVVGVDSLLTTLARCCRPAPPDAILGFVTKGKGVAVHRAGCGYLAQLSQRSPERLIAVEWGQTGEASSAQYPVDVAIEAVDRQGLLRDISEVFAKEKVNVVAASTQSRRGADGALARMTFTVEVSHATRLRPVLESVAKVRGVRMARRR